MSSVELRQVVFFGVVGVALGLTHFLSLRAVVRRYVEGRSHLPAFALHAVRLALIVPAWVIIARFGRAPGLLAAFAGFLVARPLQFYMARKGATP